MSSDICEYPRREKQSFQIFFPSGIDQKAFLTTWPGGTPVSVELDPRFVRLLLVLYDFRLKDTEKDVQPPEARGWRSREAIAMEIGRRTGYSIDAQTLSAYANQLTRKLARAFRLAFVGGRVPPLIDRRRNLGYRLPPHVELTIIDGAIQEDQVTPGN
ncbi:MAG: hypothetical protein GXX96_15435 [Planctomycetaceae bacterium]|nr:hypothetical protein [Planctomycetaceae bacterium]